VGRTSGIGGVGPEGAVNVDRWRFSWRASTLTSYMEVNVDRGRDFAVPTTLTGA